jgi:hypothetical protein
MYGYYLDFIHQYDQEYLDKYLNYVKDFMDNTRFFAYYHRATRETLKKLVSTNEVVKQNIQPSSIQFDEFVEIINKL